MLLFFRIFRPPSFHSVISSWKHLSSYESRQVIFEAVTAALVKNETHAKKVNQLKICATSLCFQWYTKDYHNNESDNFFIDLCRLQASLLDIIDHNLRRDLTISINIFNPSFFLMHYWIAIVYEEIDRVSIFLKSFQIKRCYLIIAISIQSFTELSSLLAN